ncbi:uncharacterized protein LOC117182569, partial [Belonocnema kinseyi]|uniref:uncharacterized protein LOC117182569 n=1 Tax=Belonocnema kinseyi TaxID=2817044 RepID=UPI00143CD811
MCRKCNKKHNTLLHFEQKSNDVKQSTSTEKPSTSSYHIRVTSQVYLATAIVDVIDNQGNYQPCRVMLDGGAQSCTITEACASRLGLHKKHFEIPMLSVDDMKTNIKFRTFATVKSRFNDQKSNLELLVVRTISNAMPSFPLDKNAFELPDNIFLADPMFHKPAPVEIIIGAEYVYNFLLAGKLSIPGHTAVLQKTILGWIIAGRVYDSQGIQNVGTKSSVCSFIQHTSLPLLWELDQVQPSSKRSKEEQACETHFVEHGQRDDSGRYIVHLPFNEKVHQIDESKHIAFQRFYSSERKFEKDPSLKDHYSACLNNYLDEGH